MHTKGEWIVERWGTGGTSVWLNDNQPPTSQIAYLPLHHGIEGDEVRANANLIAAAPELLSALEEILSMPTGGSREAMAMGATAAVAIAKAKGEHA